MFKGHLCEHGFEAKGGQNVDSTLIPVLIKRNTRKEN